MLSSVQIILSIIGLLFKILHPNQEAAEKQRYLFSIILGLEKISRFF